MLHRNKGGRRAFTWAAAMAAWLAAMPAVAAPSGDGACAALAALVDAQPAGPVFLASYPTAPAGPLHGTAFLYDNAAAAIALVGCGDTPRAARLGEAMLAAQQRDRFWHDGRLRNAYAAGPVADGPVKLPGWWDERTKSWLEDRYQVGSDSGNMAWAMLALLALDGAGGGPQYRAGAERLGDWLAGRQRPDGAGGFTGGLFGHEPAPEPRNWRSTEHNTDLAAAFGRLASVTGAAAWRQRADAAQAFVTAMWDPETGRFAAGTGEDGTTRNPILALDAQLWPLLAIPGGAARWARAVELAEQRLRADGGGFAYGEAGGGLWVEGTAQAALLTGLLGRDAETRALLEAVAPQRGPGGLYFAAAGPDLPTGFMLETVPDKPRLYPHLPHLGATAWVALAERRFNPFTATNGLP